MSLQPLRAETVEARVRRVWAARLGVEEALLAPEADFRRLGGDALGVLAVLAEVSRAVAGPGHEPEAARQLAALLPEPTLARFTAAAYRLLRP